MLSSLLLQIPILDIRKKSKLSEKSAQAQQCIQQDPQQSTRNHEGPYVASQQGCTAINGLQKRPPVEISFPEQSLDEYCYEFLEKSKLDERDYDQVLCRYFKNLNPDQKIEEALGKQSRQRKILSRIFGHSKINQEIKKSNYMRKKNVDCDILVVSRLWIWVFGGQLYTHCFTSKLKGPIEEHRCCHYKLWR